MSVPGTVSFLAGGATGVVSWIASMPFDTLKTRMQMQPHLYEGLIDCVRKSVAQDGVMSLHKGFVPVMYRAFVANAVAFWAYRQADRIWNDFAYGNEGNVFTGTRSGESGQLRV